MTFVLLSIGYGLILMTALSCIRGPQWWIRFADFPRIQIAVCLVLVGAVFLFVAEWARFGDWAFGLLLLASLIYQGSRIFPYTRFATRQVLDAATVPADSTIRILICNVQMENRKAQDIISLVHQYEPDLFLVLEGDDWWDQELRVLDAIYPLTIRQPQDNRYGIHFFSRLDVVNSELRFLVDPEIPSIEAKVRLRSGVTVDFHGIHPRPPLPKQGTERRDAELLILAREMLDDNRPTIVAGDLNDVAWSHTTRLFQRISGLLDPRRGRGLFNTFHADYSLLRWPLDHIFHDARFTLISFKRLPHVGSDHFPVLTELAYTPVAETRQDVPESDGQDRGEAQRRITEGIEVVRHGPAPQG